jgi:hypothetical protein
MFFPARKCQETTMVDGSQAWATTSHSQEGWARPISLKTGLAGQRLLLLEHRRLAFKILFLRGFASFYPPVRKTLAMAIFDFFLLKIRFKIIEEAYYTS